MVTDAGMPIPKGVPIVDLAVTKGVPTFAQVFEAVMEEMCAEHYFVAEETQGANPAIWSLLQNTLSGLSYDTMPHEELKAMSQNVKFAIRTGEFSSFANVILRAGVVF